MSPGRAARLACVLEVAAPKAGNVHPGASFADLDARHFLLAADAIVGPMDRARREGVGPTVLASIRATRRRISTNANLGIVLLLAPPATLGDGPVDREALRRVLESTTVDDARDVYQAIRLAGPGGLGRADRHDVADEPRITVLEAMRLAADRDLVARQYATGYADVFEIGRPALGEALGRGHPIEQAIVRTHLVLLARRGDTLIGRKLGAAASSEAAGRARTTLEAGWPSTEAGRAAFGALDAWLRAGGHSRNPGATADLVAATLYIAIQDGLIDAASPDVARMETLLA